MSNVYILLLICFTLLSCQTSDDLNYNDNEINKSKKNILLIITDDMGLDASVGYNIGNQKPKMPNIQQLILNGIKFNNVWANPVCTPTRSTILTGKYGYNTSVLNVDDALSTTELSLFQYLKDNSNYKSALIGKWHLSGRPSNHYHPNNLGVEYFAGIIGGGVQNYNNWTFSKNGNTSTSNEYSTTKLTDEAINWINNQDESWFLWLAYNAPHTPFHLPPSNLHSQVNLPDYISSINANPLPYYLSMIEAVDSEIGRLISSIGKEVFNDTTVIFIGDNGTPNQVAQQYNSRRVKGSLYRGGINVPMIISGNQVSRINEEENALINTTDLFTTISELCGIENSKMNDSKSFKSLLSNKFSSNSREYIYSEIGKNNYTIRNQTHKYIHFENGSEALYNLSINEFENPNLLSTNQLPLSSNDNLNKTKLLNELNTIRKN
ncbi:MAG: sulfatase-like hydrolase/transferase [Bacteroidota bacterium]|nr:sulfatase-like hydrolase/transferase [Bacteroidota bacterium]